MSEAYEVTFLNDSDTSYHFALYQHFPKSPGLNSVAWKVRGIPPKGVIPSSAVVNWTMNYGVSIANWNPNGAVYTGSQVVAAELGKEYQVILTDGDIPAIQSDPIGDTHPGCITLVNDTNIALEMGATIDGTFVAVQTVNGGERMNSLIYGYTCTANTKMERSIGRNSTAHMAGFAQIIHNQSFYRFQALMQVIYPRQYSPSDLQTMIPFPRVLPRSSLVRTLQLWLDKNSPPEHNSKLKGIQQLEEKNLARNQHKAMETASVTELLAILPAKQKRSVEIAKPTLQPLQGEHLKYKSANGEVGARLDVAAQNFWGKDHQTAYFDVRIFNPFAQSYANSSISKCYRKHEMDKKREYEERQSCAFEEPGHFIPIHNTIL
eukprot:Em0010g744a